MTTTIRGSLAAAALCALLAACGGDGNSPAPTVLPASVAITGNARAEAGGTQQFATDLPTTTGLTFRWDFGDGSTGTGATASHAYAATGSYVVTLAVANDAEDLRTATTTVQVGAYANVAGLNCTQADASGWCWQHAVITGHAINDLFFVDATHAWAVGDGMTLLKSSDAGDTWTPVALDPNLATASLRSVRFRDALHGMVLTDQGTALQTSDGGATWTSIALGNLALYSGPATFVDYSASRIVLQSPYSGGIASVDGGATWKPVALSVPLQATASDCWSLYASQVQRAAGCGSITSTVLTPNPAFNGFQNFSAAGFASDNSALVVGYSFSYDTYSYVAQAWTSADGGASWSSFTANGLPTYSYYSQQLRMLDAQTGVLYLSSDFSSYVTRNGGHDWTPIVSAPALVNTNGYRASGFVGHDVLWQAVGNRVGTSVDLGQTWHVATVNDEAGIATNQQTSLAVVQYTDAGNFVVAINHRFYVTHDAGTTFKRVLGADPRDAGAPSAAGDFASIRAGRFLTANGALLSTADGGRTWARQDYPTSSGMPVALHFTSATQGWLILDGKLAHSTDSGATWSTPLANAAMSGLTGMSWGDAKHGWTWNYGALFVTVDGGATWTLATLPVNTQISSAVMTGPLAGVAVSAYNGAEVTQDGGATWQTVANTNGLGTLVHATGQTVWSLSGNQMQRSKDGGRTWQVAGPATWNLQVTGLSFADALHGWLITSTGTVLRTIDGGDSWSNQPVGTDLVLQAVVAVDATTAWIITRDGQILSTATAGN